MGRKKKEEQIKIETTTPTVVYHGGATIKIIKNGRVVKQTKKHNEGGTPLFRFLADCMAGNFYPNNRPTCIRVGNFDGTNFTDYSLSYVVSSTSSVSRTTVNISFTIPGGLINVALISNDKPINCLRVYSVSNVNNEDSYSAQIVLSGEQGTDEAPITSFNTDESLLIVWSMNIDNIATQSNNQGE